jgi:prolyl oligopeptidase
MALTKQLPPHTAVEPVTDILHGVTVADPYRWLEHQYSPLTRKWLEEQTTYSRAYFRALAEREPLKKQIEELIAVETVSDPWKVGSRFFYLKRGRQQERALLPMRDINTIAVFHIVYPS